MSTSWNDEGEGDDGLEGIVSEELWTEGDETSDDREEGWGSTGGERYME